MLVSALGVMIPIVAIVSVFVMIIYVRKYENAERMAMIEKGVDASIFPKKSRSAFGALRASLLLIGAGLGLLLGYFLDRTYDMEEVAYFSMVLIFGGLGLGASYVIEEKKIREEKGE